MSINTPMVRGMYKLMFFLTLQLISVSVFAQAPTIITQPFNTNVCTGSSGTIGISASNATSYQWQVNSGSGWSNLSNAGIYSGVTTNTLTLTSVTATYNTYQYRCIATGSTSPAATSNAATLSVVALPTVSSVTGGSVCAGNNGQVSAVASSGATVDWYTASTGGTLLDPGNIYTIPNASATATYYAGSYINVGGSGIDTVQTPYNTNNGQRGAMFDVVPTTNMTVTGFDVNIYVGTTSDYEIYYKVGTHVGFETNASAWIPLDTVTSLTSLGTNVPTPMGFNISVPLQANTRYAFYITNTFGGGLHYTDGTGVGNFLAGNSDVTIYEGVGKSYPFGITISNRRVNATMHYTKGVSCASASRTGATLTVNANANITVNPPNRSITAGNNTTFGITATNANSYQWQVNAGGGWSNVANTGIYSGATTNTLSLNNVATAYNSYQYRCIATNSSNCPDTSNVGTLSVTGSAPSISTNPTNANICDGANTTFSVTASGTFITYQWQVNTGSGWSNLSNTGIYNGVVTSTLFLTAATAAYDGYQYRCVVTGSVSPAATTTAATLTVNTLPTITTQPTNSTIGAGSNTSFSISATGAGLSYQWQVNSGSGWTNLSNTGIYSGATTSTLSLTSPTAAYDGYQYRCVVSGTCTPNATSNTATLTVNTAPAITAQPSSAAICNGASTTFSVTATNATAYQWQVNTGSGWTNLSNTGIYSGATTNTLSLTSATLSYTGYQYRCEVTGPTTPNAISNAATLTINVPPTVSVQPTDVTICNLASTSFSVTATNATGYQWQVNSGSGWSNVANTGIYSGATTNTLSLTAATAVYDGYRYRCLVGGSCTPIAVSSAATLTINAAPAITAQPTNTTICASANTSFSITATGVGLGYQWQVNSGSGWSNVANTGIYSGATTNTLSLTAATATYDGYQYRCVASGSCTPDATSNHGTLTVNSAPSITSHPPDRTICEGSNTTFTVSTNNTTGYQWQVSANNGLSYSNISNTGVYSGASTATLTLTSATSGMSGYLYRCVLSGLCTPNLTSSHGMLMINSAPSITSHPPNRTICEGSNTTFSVTATGTGLSYQWEENRGTGWNSISNGGVYSGATTATLTLTAVTSANDGYQYRCVVSGTCSPTAIGTISNSSSLTINSAPSITTQPKGANICVSGNTYFNVEAAGTSLSYQWQVDTGSGFSNISNGSTYANVTTDSLSVNAVLSMNGYKYRLRLIGLCGTVYSGTVTLSVYDSQVDSVRNDTTCVGTTAHLIAYPSLGSSITWYDSLTGGSNIGSGDTLRIAGATNSTTYYAQAQYPYSHSAVSTPYKGQQWMSGAMFDVLPTKDMIITGFDANILYKEDYQIYYKVGTHVGFESNASAWTLLGTVRSLAPVGPNVPTPMGINISVPLQANTRYAFYITDINYGMVYCSVGGTIGNYWAGNSDITVYQGVGKDFPFGTNLGVRSINATIHYDLLDTPCVSSRTPVSLTINDTPSVTSGPINSTICSGNATYYKVSATGTGLTYQWQVNTGSGWSNLTNTGIYSGVTTDSLVLIGATSSNNGYQYRAIVSGTCSPSATSNAASLTIDVAPSVTGQPTNRTICENTNTSFNVSATGTGIMYQWQVNTGSGWTNISNGGIYSGATTATLNLTNATASNNGNQYRVVVSGTCSPGATSNAATLTIQTSPVITAQPSNRTICSGDNTTYGVTATGTNLTYQWQMNIGAGWTNLSNTGIYSGATTSTLNLTGATTTQNGYQYRVVVSGTCSPSATSNAASLTIDTAPAITSQPVNRTICDGGNTTFATTATGTSLTYQWQVNTGSSWTNISNGGIYSGASTSTLSLTTATTSNNGYQYRCVVSGTCSPSATSVSATLTVNSLPSISVSPIAKTICDGNNTSYTVTASGTGISYQWQVNIGSGWTNISNGGIYGGATTSLLTLTGASTTYNGYQYRVVVSGTCTPSVTSSAANLTVHPIVTPTVGITASATTICATTSVTFTVSSSTNGGSSPSYQWKLNGNNVGSNSTSYSTTSLSNGDVVTCVMTTNAPCPTNPTATSNSITMTVNPLLLPTISISSATGDSVCDTRTASFTANITNGGSAPVYQWKINGNNVGTNSATYATNSLTDGDVVSCELTSNALCASPKVVNSNSIRMRVIPLSYASATIAATPETEICKGDQVVVHCYYTNGGSSPKFEWYLNGNLQSNTAGSYTTTNFNDNDAIYCVYTNGNVCPVPVTTNTELMTVYQTISPSVTVVASSGNVIAPGWTVTFTAQPTNGGANPTYAWRKNGQFITGETGVTYTDNDLRFGDKIDVVMKGDWKCKDKEYSMSNVLVVNIPTDVVSQEGEVKELELYPNPNRGVFNLKGILGTGNGEAKVYIMNSVGQKVYETVVQVRAGRVEEQLRMPQSLSAGMYMLSIEMKGERAQKKFSIIE